MTEIEILEGGREGRGGGSRAGIPSGSPKAASPRNARVPEATLGGLLRRASESTRGVCFIDRWEKESFHSYQEIYRRASLAAGGLQAMGIRAGDRGAIILPTSVDFFEAFFGALLAGAVPVALYPPYRLGRLDEYHERTAAMLEKSGARLLLQVRGVGRLLGRTT